MDARDWNSESDGQQSDPDVQQQFRVGFENTDVKESDGQQMCEEKHDYPGCLGCNLSVILILSILLLVGPREPARKAVE